jgi:signal transduction histidine kinase
VKVRDFLIQLRSWRLLTLVGIILTLTFVHQLGKVERSPFHQILDILPYVPIILGSLWFGLAGGLTCSLLTSACYVTHLYLQEGGDLLGANLHRTLNILMFPVIGVVTGYLAEKQLAATAGYRKLAAELEQSYAELRMKTRALFENEEHLQRANRLSALGELTAGLAHEIGNPLGGIKGAAEILADGLPPGHPKERFARLLLKEVTRLDAVVSRFLASARPREETDGTADVGETFREVASLCDQALKQGRLSLLVEVGDRLPPVAANPHQIQQVFLNLLLNAIQATPPGGRIRLRALERDGEVECLVQDDGRGIPPEDLPRLFDPFFTTKPDGTGLGLAITRRILETCRGQVSVESRPGQGAAFTVTLPTRTTIGAQEEGAHR